MYWPDEHAHEDPVAYINGNSDQHTAADGHADEHTNRHRDQHAAADRHTDPNRH